MLSLVATHPDFLSIIPYKFLASRVVGQGCTEQLDIVLRAVHLHFLPLCRGGGVLTPRDAVASEYKVIPSQPALYHCHLVGSQCSSLVTADGVGTAHGFTSCQHTYQAIVLHHAFHGVRQGDSHGQGQAFRDGDNNQGDRYHYILKEGSRSGDVAFHCGNLDDLLDGQHQEGEEGCDHPALADHSCQPIQLHLQRGLGTHPPCGHG
mmetsp:Transcript_94415/g.163179  ORF Transcript_94415/g.163179 Transcript_94415/m.163179 type:complete len:206 (-) Transcript_94415:876-1493(-)